MATILYEEGGELEEFCFQDFFREQLLVVRLLWLSIPEFPDHLLGLVLDQLVLCGFQA